MSSPDLVALEPDHRIAPRRRERVQTSGPRDGRAVVLIHGLASLSDEVLFPLQEPLTGSGYRVIAIDRAGYGGSDPAPPGAMSPSAQAERLRQRLRRMGLRDVIVVAHSVGAASALRLAQSRDTPVAGLVLVNPFCRPTRPKAAIGLRAANAPLIGRLIRRALPALAPLLGRRMVRAALHRGQRSPDFRAFPWRRMAQPTAVTAMADDLLNFNMDMIALRTDLRRLKTPTLVLADPDDPVIDGRAHARWLSARLPVAAVRWRPQGHLLHHAAPDEVLDAVQSVEVAAVMAMRRIA
jgi:pimeloyl-ACP methyl ester carboxylesterase